MNKIELLLSEILGCQRHELYLKGELRLKSNQRSLLKDALLKIDQGVPLQQVIGRTNFMGFDFMVNSSVFIPRPETEILVETAQRRFLDLGLKDSDLDILDLCTGCGCIAVSLAKFFDHAQIDACDISLKALEVARENASLNRVRINFSQSDLFSAYRSKNLKYDLIISNPPYIQSCEINNLPLSVQHDPHIALDAGSDGLSFYRRIIKESHRYLKEKGFLILEIGFGQAKEIKKMFKNSGKSEIIDIVKDYNNIDRVLVAQLKKVKAGDFSGH